MKPKLKKCWAKDCDKDQIKDSLYCVKHDKQEFVETNPPAYVGDSPDIPH